jgi:tetratricopeptide (TPR) repeat protein
MKPNFFLLLVLCVLEGCTQHPKVSRDPEGSRVLVQKADQVMQGSPRWLEMLDSAILLDPENGLAYREKSVWFTKTGDYVTGYALLEKAVQLNPHESLGYRGWLRLYKLHDYQGAIEDLKKFDAITPATADYAWEEHVNYLIGLAEMGSGNFRNAVVAFNDYIKSETARSGESWINVYAFVDKAVCHRTLNEFDSALHYIDLSLKYYPQCPESFFEKGNILKAAGKVDEACQSWQSALQYARSGRTRRDPYKEYFNQLYIEDIEEAVAGCAK